MRNTVVEVRIEGYEPFKYDHCGSQEELALIVDPESGTVRLCAAYTTPAEYLPIFLEEESA